MTSDNSRTLRSYEQHVPEYITGTAAVLAGAEKAWVDAVLDRLAQNSKILEVGSGPGRDATYIRDRGYDITCTDAASAFVDHLRRNALGADLMNVLVDPIPTGYDLILANSVLLHFSHDEFGSVLTKIANALNVGGLFAFSLKRGDGEEWSDHKLNAPRYFCYWQPDGIARSLIANRILRLVY